MAAPQLERLPEHKGNGGATGSAPTPQVALLAMYAPGSIFLARPLTELYCHARSLKLPSFALLARCVNVLAMFIFRWHVCDRTLLVKKDGMIHSLEGRVEDQTSEEFRKKYPFVLEGGWVLHYNGKIKPDPNSVFCHKYKEVFVGGNLFVKIGDFSDYKEITAQTIREYYQKFYGIKITNKEKGNTIYDLFQSKCFDLQKAPKR